MSDAAINESFDVECLQFWYVPLFPRQSAGTELSRMIASDRVCQNANPLS